MHVFADASEKAYAAAAYIKTTNHFGHCFVHLVAAKTRIAPIKQISLSRLELCAAHLAAKLASKVQTALHLDNIQTHGWTDSKIVLAWLADHPKRWHTFIGSRTSQILAVIQRSKWHHVKSAQNPCDCASRGITPSKLVDYDLWWQGPSFLKDGSNSYLEKTTNVPDTSLEERKVILHTTIQLSFLQELLSRYSPMTKLRRVTARCIRLFKNRKLPKEQRQYGPLSVNELQYALKFWIRFAQSESFTLEIHNIQHSKSLPKKSPLASLTPFIDDFGILRVGGRLHEAEIDFNQKHPIILPKTHRVSEMIIEELHVIHLHASQRLIQSTISRKYWILDARQLIKRIIYKCIKCIRFRAQPHPQQMGRLPKVRITPARPFQRTGVDYAGPFMVRSWKGRGAKTHKAYIALFICMSTKAVHLELVSSLSTDDFIAALKRFFSRRGLSEDIYSDNGTAFVGANRLLKELGALMKSQLHQDKLISFAAEQEVNFHFIPPSAPNFGGIWESGIKLIKSHLRRQVANALLTFEEFSTLLCQIEAVINSRPITVKSNSVDDIEALTPGHFLVGGPLISAPARNVEQVPINHLSRWEFVQKLHQTFWRRWHSEYLTQLQRRSKWKVARQNLKPDDVVIIKDDNVPPATWLLGRILQTHPRPDGLVRVATVKTRSGIFKRSKLVVLLESF